MEKESKLEKVSGNLTTNVISTLIAASTGTVMPALLPVLTTSIAAKRQSKRVEAALIDLNNRLALLEKNLEGITDIQFELLGDLVTEILGTTNEDKIELLKRASIYSICDKSIEDRLAHQLSRALREISVIEYRFLQESRNHPEIVLIPGEDDQKGRDGKLWIHNESPEADIVISLSNMGLLANISSGAGGTLHFTYRKVAHKLIELCELGDQ